MHTSFKSLMAATVLSAGAITGSAMADTYAFDPSHTHVVFMIDHLGLSRTVGVANDITGGFTFVESDPTASALNVTIKVASIFSNQPQRDADIQGADWFNATEFPDITFVGTEFTATDAKVGTITGDLTIAGVTRPVTLNVAFNGLGANPWTEAKLAGFSATTTIKRSDFGMNALQGLIGDEVDLMIEAEGVIQ